jgi:hypothetical protein
MADNIGAMFQQLFVEDASIYAATDGKIFNGVSMNQITLGDKEACIRPNHKIP